MKKKGLIVLVCLLILILIGGLIYYFGIRNKLNSNVVSLDKYEIGIYDEDYSATILYDEYIVLEEENMIVKQILTLDGKVIFDNSELDSEYQNFEFMKGTDNNLYGIKTVLNEDISDEDNYYYDTSLYKLENNKLEKIITLEAEKNTRYSELTIDYDSFYVSLKALVKERIDSESAKVEDIILLDGTKLNIKDGYVSGDYDTNEFEISTMYRTNNIVVVNDNKKYGTYDLDNNKIILDYEYDYLEGAISENMIAVKDNQYGIIDSTGKVLVDYKYDFIEVTNIGTLERYLVIKNHKIYLMDEKLNINNEGIAITGEVNKDDYGRYDGNFNMPNDDNYLIIDTYDEGIENEDIYYLLDKDGKLVFKTDSDFNTIFDRVDDSQFYYVEHKDNNYILDIYDSEFNKMMEVKLNEEILSEEESYYTISKVADIITIDYKKYYTEVEDYESVYEYYNVNTSEKLEDYEAEETNEKVINEDIKLVNKGDKIVLYVEDKKIYVFSAEGYLNIDDSLEDTVYLNSGVGLIVINKK